jgi:hypothetical protein
MSSPRHPSGEIIRCENSSSLPIQKEEANNQAIARILESDINLNKKNGAIIPRLSPELAASNLQAAFFRETHEILLRGIAPVFLPCIRSNLTVPQAVNSDIKSLNALTQTCRRTQGLFQKSLTDTRTERLGHLAKLILSGEENDVEEAVDLVKKTPSILNYSVQAADPKGRTLERKPLQIAAMAGDFDFKEDLAEKDRGIVERLALAASLSKEEIDEQLQIITSEEAIHQNEARNQRVLTAIKAFGEGILEIKKAIVIENSLQNNEDKTSHTPPTQMSFEDFQARCKPIIDKLEKALQPNPQEVIRLGYIFDIKIRRDAEVWFKDKVNSFGGWYSNQSNVFYVNGIGKLDNNLSARDAQAVLGGMGNFVAGGTVPRRSVKNADGSSYFFNSASGLGVLFCLGYSGERWPGLGQFGPLGRLE